MSRKVSNQEFGGSWSLLKLETVAKYLSANTALRDKPTSDHPFRRIYVDAFAGSGAFTFGEEPGLHLFDEAALATSHAGSARRALETIPPFDKLVFIELSRRNLGALNSLASVHPGATVVGGDANEEVQRICSEMDWRKWRGVIFLDPFGTSVHWTTLQAISKTNALDLWYLFPLSGLYRNAPHKKKALNESKRRTLNRILGTSEWETIFYGKRADSQGSFQFDELGAESEERRLDVTEMEKFVKDRLGSEFAHVESPVRLLGPSQAPIYSLFFAVSNKSGKAIKLASKIARDLMKKL